MKRTFTLLLLVLLAVVAKAQILIQPIEALPEAERSRLSLTEAAPEIQLPQYDYKALQEESREVTIGIPFRFGKAHDMKIGLGDGEWYDDGDRQSRWKLKISSPGAYSINLIFDQLAVPEGAALYIYDQNRTTVMGPIDESNSDVDGEFWADLLPGDAVILELLGNKEAADRTALAISKVIHGYINTFSTGFGASAPCNIDIDCPVGQPFAEESNAVARLLINNGESFCTGAMVNNTCNDFTPYLLTANHCLDPTVNNWVFRFQYRSPNPRCDGQGGGTDNLVNIFYNGGATVRANRQASDFALLELTNRPAHTDLSYLGWSRDIAGITSTAGIHHPRGDLMKISIDEDAPVQRSTNVVIEGITYPAGNLWEVDFDIGTVERGSSGSPLLNQERRLIGQLLAVTINPSLPNEGRCQIRDGLYGRFDVSWGRDATGNFLPGRNATNSLAPWLDPDNTGDMTTLPSA